MQMKGPFGLVQMPRCGISGKSTAMPGRPSAPYQAWWPAPSRDDQRILDEQGMVERQHAIDEGGGVVVRRALAVGAETQMGRARAIAEADAMRQAVRARQRPEEGRVIAEAEGHGRVAGVGDAGGHGERRAVEPVGHVEREGEGIGLPGLVVVGQTQRAGCVVLRDELRTGWCARRRGS